MKSRIIIIIAALTLLIAPVQAQVDCAMIVQSALERAKDSCTGLARNQACLGNFAVNAVPQFDAVNFQFEAVGDVTDLAAIQSMKLSSFDLDANIWGLALMQVQANIPNTLPGQNVIVLLFGDVSIENAASSVQEQVPPEQELFIGGQDNVRVRAFPNTNAPILGVIRPGTPITATGRTADATWVRIRYETQTGWMFSPLLTGEQTVNDLMVVDAQQPEYGAMQAFYFNAGIGRPACDEVPYDGMLVQTPEGVASVNLLINEVRVEMGSTLYFRRDANNALVIAPLEGAARVTAFGESQIVIEGSQVTVPMTENVQASAPPSEAQSYLDADYINDLPLSLLERDIEVDAGLLADELNLLRQYQAVFDQIAIEDADDLLDYLARTNAPDIPAYLLDNGYDDFGDDLEDYLETNLGYDLDNYPDYTADDVIVPTPDVDLDFDDDGDDDDITPPDVDLDFDDDDITPPDVDLDFDDDDDITPPNLDDSDDD